MFIFLQEAIDEFLEQANGESNEGGIDEDEVSVVTDNAVANKRYNLFLNVIDNGILCTVFSYFDFGCSNVTYYSFYSDFLPSTPTPTSLLRGATGPVQSPGGTTTWAPETFSILSWNLDGLDEKNLEKRTKAVVELVEK